MSDLDRILALELPVIVRLGQRQMTVAQVLALVPGAIIELPKNAESELDLLVNNKQVGFGQAVKVGENFGLRITYIGDVRERIAALGEGSVEEPAAGVIGPGEPGASLAAAA